MRLHGSLEKIPIQYIPARPCFGGHLLEDRRGEVLPRRAADARHTEQLPKVRRHALHAVARVGQEPRETRRCSTRLGDDVRPCKTE